LTQSPEPAWLIGRTQLALHYLERLSADSAWAHRASGLRGSLWRALAVTPGQRDGDYYARLVPLVETAFWLLQQAAREIPDPRRGQTG
jgi:hypothetical protein